MGEWQHGLCGCFDNCCICICTWFCPCYVFGKIAEKVGDSCCLHGILFFIPVANFLCLAWSREKVRSQKGIEGSIVWDCLASWLCFPCAICQAANEVDALDRGISTMALEMARE